MHEAEDFPDIVPDIQNDAIFTAQLEALQFDERANNEQLGKY